MAGNSEIHLRKFTRLEDDDDDNDGTPNGDQNVVVEDEDEDADGEAVDPEMRKPKVRNMFFRDGKRRIDFVLVWEPKEKKQEEGEAAKARRIFEESLEKEGLELERDERKPDFKYVKIHAPFEVLARYANIMKLRMPMKESLVLRTVSKKYESWENPGEAVSVKIWATIKGFFRKFLTPFQIDEEQVPPIKQRYTSPYSQDKNYLFDIPEDKDTFFSHATRSWIVDFILRRKPFSEDKQKAYSFGVNKMISDNYYSAAYPLHEGHWKAGSAPNPRKLLFDYWAYWRNALKFQPIDHVREYFGEKIGMYFAWLGFYTTMLVPAALFGLAVFIYGLIIMYTNITTTELCDESANYTMCPLCDRQCPYWKLHEACTHAAASRVFDNGATVVFAIFMSLWGTLFLEFWKRKQATIQHNWDLTNFVSEEEPPRPEYLAKLDDWHTLKVNPVTGLKEPHLPFWRRRFPIFLCSYGVMLFLALLAIAAVVGVIAYRVSMLAALQLSLEEKIVVGNASDLTTKTVNIIYKNASLVTTCTAALINLLFIIILNIVYGYIAFKLTDWECLRTQSEYDNSITIKLFTLQFVNYFASIVYIAFFKGNFIGRPGKYRTIFGARQEECEPGGCLIELCIQLAIIMVGKQLIQNNFIEIVIPKLIKLFKRKCSKETREQRLARTPWQKDFKLQPASTTSLFYEYLEMVLQFGFLTIFCAAFPLAPLFALLNNIIEIRIDANKFICQLRRPVAERAASIGIWASVLYGISRIAIISNAFIIALTSDTIPRLVYELRYSEDGSLTGYVNFTLAYFNTADFTEGHRPSAELQGDVETCRYRDFRNPPWEDPEYRRSEVFWHMLAARLAFVVVFENVVVVVTSLLAWMVPDVPAVLREKIRREAYTTNEIILETELMRANGQDMGNLDNIVDLFVKSTSTHDSLDAMEGARYSPRNSDEDVEPSVLTHRKSKGDEEPRTYV